MKSRSIGPFFCTDDKIYAYKVPLAEAEPYSECLTTSVSHLVFWDTEVAHKYPNCVYNDAGQKAGAIQALCHDGRTYYGARAAIHQKLSKRTDYHF